MRRMTGLSAIYESRYILLAGVCATSVLLIPPSTAHGTGAAAELRVNPILCVIDVTQDGSNQTLQVPTESCIPLIPELTSPPGATISGHPGQVTTRLPFAGADPVSIQQPQPVSAEPASWSPIAAAQAGTVDTGAFTDHIAVNIVIGATVLVLATAVAIDVFVLESSHTRAALHRIWRRFTSTN